MHVTAQQPVSSVARSELRASHAGETGAVWIYRGILTANWLLGDKELRRFARHHLQTEKQHLMGFESMIHRYRGSALLLLWIIAGFVTGALPALMGRNWVYYTVYCVESFVDTHYKEQFELLVQEAHPDIIGFTKQMHDFHADEKAHKEEALNAMTSPPTWLMRQWGLAVHFGSKTAVKLARII
jgi:ubiquinone biosynthesis monooxygenase Coq7